MDKEEPQIGEDYATENDDNISCHTGGYSPCITGTTPPPPQPLYHNHRSDHPFDKGGNFATLLHSEIKMAMGVEQSRDCAVDVGEGGGVCLTWEDLWVTVPDGMAGSRSILEASTGYAEPGRVLAIIGPSGSGKTTLLDALAGRLASNTRQSGNILINGRKQSLAFGTSVSFVSDIGDGSSAVAGSAVGKRIICRREDCSRGAYVTQDDILLRTLTVREAVYYSAQLQLPDSMSSREKRERAEATIRDMGLVDAMDTRIARTSGGQKRRVSICVEILTRPHLLFMDEPTSGLDSAASYHVMNRIVRLATQSSRTVVVSLHQPSGEVFDLFHNLCLLSNGKTVYFGPTLDAVEFFAKNGFPCPPLKNPADHYLRTINRDFEQGEEEEGSRYSPTSTTEAINILVKSYKGSDHLHQVIKKVSQLSSMEGGRLRKGGQSGFLNQCFVLTRRSSVNMLRDTGYYWLRFTIYLGIAIALGTIFYHLGYTFPAIMDRASVLMFIAGFMTFMTIGGFPSFVEDMKIFERERLNGHYGVGAYVISHTLSSAPFLALVSFIPGAIAYYLVGLQRSVPHFVYFSLVLYLCMVLVESLMMIVASVVPDFLMGIISGAGVQGLMMLTGGFFRLPPDMPGPVWKYPCYYIAFHKYAFQGFNKNEFIGLTFKNKVGYIPPMVTGMEILEDTFEIEVGYSKWVDLEILVGMLVVYRLLFFVIIKVTEKVKPMLRSMRGVQHRKLH